MTRTPPRTTARRVPVVTARLCAALLGIAAAWAVGVAAQPCDPHSPDGALAPLFSC